MANRSLTTIATAAAQFLGILDSGEALSTQQLTDALAAANNLLDNFSSEQVMLLQATRLTFTPTGAVQGYTIGPAQVINVTRPMAIASAAAILTNGPGSPIKVVSVMEWEALPDRQAQSWQPRFLFYDRGFTTGTLYLSPIPLGNAMLIELFVWTALTQFADVTTPIAILPGYERMLDLAMAIELAPQYDMKPSEALMQNYQDAMARVRNLNAQLLGVEPPAGQVIASSGATIAPKQQ